MTFTKEGQNTGIYRDYQSWEAECSDLCNGDIYKAAAQSGIHQDGDRRAPKTCGPSNCDVNVRSRIRIATSLVPALQAYSTVTDFARLRG